MSKGAWPFSTIDHGWPISDCTAEGLKVRATPRPQFVCLLATFVVLMLVFAVAGGIASRLWVPLQQWEPSRGTARCNPPNTAPGISGRSLITAK